MKFRGKKMQSKDIGILLFIDTANVKIDHSNSFTENAGIC